MEPIGRFETKSDLAYEAIRKSITDGQYLPGEKVGISEVARQLTTSDIPVREAMQRLQAEGFLEYTPHIGFRVTRPDFHKYTDVYDVRQLLEGEAAARAAEKIKPESLAELKALHEKMRLASTDGDSNSFSDLNYAFHAAIFAACGNPALVRQIEQAGAIYPRTRAIFVMFPQRLASALREHREIIRNLERRDREGTRRAYLHHMAEGYALLLRQHQASEAKTVTELAEPRRRRVAAKG